MGIEAFIARTIQILLALAGAYLIALWFVLVVWTYRDIESRSRNVVTQIFSTLLVVLFWIPGVLLYLVLRPKDTLDAAFQRSLEEEYLLQDLEELPLCPTCERYVEDDFVLCPHCNTRLREPCLSCERLIDLRWSICPYCGVPQGGEAAREQERAVEPAARWRAPARLSRRPAVPAAAVAVESSAKESAIETDESEREPASASPASLDDAEAQRQGAHRAEPVAPPETEPPPAETGVREPIPLVPIPRGRFRRVGGDASDSPSGGTRPPEVQPVASHGPFTSILGSRNVENGRSGASTFRARRVARQADRTKGDENRDQVGPARGGVRSFLPTSRSEEQVAADPKPGSDVIAVGADGKPE